MKRTTIAFGGQMNGEELRAELDIALHERDEARAEVDRLREANASVLKAVGHKSFMVWIAETKNLRGQGAE